MVEVRSSDDSFISDTPESRQQRQAEVELDWPEQREVGGGVIRPSNYIIRPLPSTYDQKLSLLRHTVSKMKAGSASRAMLQIG